MSNYTETTNFTALTTAQAVINGAAFDLEYGNIATAIATKFDNLSAGYTGPFKLLTSGAAVTLTVTGTAGTSAVVVTGSGVQLGAPTGGEQGPGTLNVASGLYVNGVAVTAGVYQPVVKIKGSATSRSSTTTITNDPDLTYAIPAAGTYRIQIRIYINPAGGGGGGWGGNINYSGTISNSNFQLWTTNGAGVTIQNSGTSTISTTVNNQLVQQAQTQANLAIDAILVASGTGTIALAWAQTVSNAAATIVAAGGSMTVERLA